jgi:hypothetical protein
MDPAVGSERQTMLESFPGLRRPHRECDHFAAGLLAELDGSQEGPDIERAHLEPHALALQTARDRIELHL